MPPDALVVEITVLPDVSRHSTPLRPDPVKSPEPTTDQVSGRLATSVEEAIAPALTRETIALPLVVSRQKMSLVRSPSKSCATFAAVGVQVAASACATRMRGLVTEPPVRVSVIDTPVEISALWICDAVAFGQADLIAAMAPATCGVAIEVPTRQS